jgi:H3 lysine-79-specific histone-lysine N-methyltransferase
MPETERKLVLHSPASSEIVEYRWPLTRTETWDEAVEIVETIRWVCRDFPDLKLAVEKFILNSFEPTSYDSMKQLCERYNRAVSNIKKLWSGRQPPPGIDAPPSIPLLRHIINQAYSRAVNSPEDLNSYEPFSPEVHTHSHHLLVPFADACPINRLDIPIRCTERLRLSWCVRS